MSLDRAKAGLAAFVRTLTARIDYLALYPAKVVSQNADGTLELQPDDARLPQVSKVPIRLGIPGATVKVNANGRVLMGFAGGNPRYPIATLWELAVVTELVIGDSGQQFVALSNLVKDRLDAIVATFNSHTHGVTVSGSSFTAPSGGGACTGSANVTSAAGPTNSASNAVASTVTKTK